MEVIGLLGKKITNSLSPLVHSHLLKKKYQLITKATAEEATEFLKTNFKALNVTMPYKELAFQKANKKSLEALETGVCNLLVNKDDVITAYNTDVYGFEMLLKKSKTEVKHKNCVILGTGASSKTVAYVLNKLKAKSIKYLSTNKRDKDIFGYDDLKEIRKTHIIINTTPIGHDDFTDYCLIRDASKLQKLETFIDLNYHSILSQQGRLFKDSGVKCVNGLYMLVAQAVKAEEIIQDKDFSSRIDEIYLDILIKEYNIVFVGHPFSGKTFIGRNLAENLNMNFVDTDEVIVEQEKKCVFDIFADEGERYFREKETRVIGQYNNKKGYVISLGGGAVLTPENMIDLQHNSVIINVTKNLHEIKFDELTGRPLIQNKKDLHNIVALRRELYRKYATFEVKNGEISEVIKEIRSKL